MKIHNVRLMLATNSSSSHCLIFLSGKKIKQYHDSGIQDEGYHWDHFTLIDKDSKLHYLATQLKPALEALNHPDIAKYIYRQVIGFSTEVNEDTTIDHQSQITWPYTFGTTLPNIGFMQAFVSMVLRPDLLILGGNDNESETPEDALPGNRRMFGIDEQRPFIARYDEKYDYWSLFQPSSGLKLRITLDDNKAAPTKATAPELVDIKITDYCPFGCPFCYQDSTREGKHAELMDIHRIADALAELEVFEVAIGGGEPTLHPDFGEILAYFREMGIVPNFTTKNLAWLRDPHKLVPWLGSAGAFAFSPTDSDDIRELETLVRLNGIDTDRVKIHIVMGTLDQYVFESRLNAARKAGFGVTLLGYKTNGRGADVKPEKYDWWLPTVQRMVKSHEAPSISIDTVLAAEFEKEIRQAKIPDYLFHTVDGKFSCYIDMLSSTINASSYGSLATMQALDMEWGADVPLADAIKVAFAAY